MSRHPPPSRPHLAAAGAGFRGVSTMERTLAPHPVAVPVREFRARISHLERLVNVDRHACRGAVELARWRRAAQRIGSELIATTCARATREDWERRERAIERSASLLTAERSS